MIEAVVPTTAPNWQLLWAQNLLLLVVQFTTGAALYSQDDRYARYLTVPLEFVTSRSGRDALLWLHATSGVVLVVVNVWFTIAWVSDSPLTLVELYSADPALTVSTFALTGTLVAMAILGVSLYANTTPDTRLPLWRFEYARSRKLHRGLFAVVIVLLGHHIFVLPRVVAAWTRWLGAGEPFGLVMLLLIGIWGVMAGQVAAMLGEWVTGVPVGGWERSVAGQASVAGLAIAGLLTAIVVLPAL